MINLNTIIYSNNNNQVTNINNNINNNNNNKTFSTTMGLNSTEKMNSVDTTEYTDLFRGLSTFELSNYPSTIETKTEPIKQNQQDLISSELNKLNNSEKTYQDLTDLVLQQQQQHIETDSKVIMNENTSEIKQLIQLNPVKFMDDFTFKEQSLDVSNSLTNNNNEIITKVENESSPNDTFNDSMTDDSLNVTISENRLRSTRNRVIVKRLSNTSNSTASSATVIEKRRGRKPISLVPGENKPAKLTKKQQLIEESKGLLVCFGNKVVEKDTDEYKKRRKNNNEAVKKCRQKTWEEQKEKEEKMKKLDEENKKLTNTVEHLNKELNVLRNLIIKMSPQNKLPDYLDKIIKSIDQT